MKKIHFILVLFSVLAISCFAAKDQKKTKKEPKPVTYVIQPDSNTYAILGKTMTDILFSPSKVTCYAVKGKAQVDKSDLEVAFANSMIILSSVKYNNDILTNLVGENVLTSKEIEFNIFETKKTESNFLEVEANNDYKEETNDPDLID